MITRRFTRFAVLATFMTTLSGCISVLPDPAVPDALFRIEPAADTVSLADHIRIIEPEAPSIYAGRALVSEDETGALRLLPGAEWAGPATRQFQLALIDSFTVSAEASAMLPEAATFAPYELAVRLQKLGLRGQTAECVASVTVIEQSNRTIRAHTVIEARVEADKKRSLVRARALKSAAEACVAKVAGFASGTLGE